MLCFYTAFILSYVITKYSMSVPFWRVHLRLPNNYLFVDFRSCCIINPSQIGHFLSKGLSYVIHHFLHLQ